MELMILKCIKSKLMTNSFKKIVASTSDIKNDNNLQNEKFFCMNSQNTSKIISDFLKDEINKN